jgi:hypothetical protein
MGYENPLRWRTERLTLEELISLLCVVGLLAFSTILLVLLVFLVAL